MATSGSKSIAVTSHDTLKFSWSESSQSIANNTTTISWTLQLITDAYGRISSTVAKDWSVTVNGTKYSGTNTIGIGNNETKTLASGTTTISHNSDGTKTFSYSFSQEFAITFSGSYIGTKTGSGTGTLDTIPRSSSYGTITGNTIGGSVTVNITRNSSSFTHQLWYKVGGAGWVDLGTGIGTSKTFTIDMSTCSQFPNATSGNMQLCLRTFNGTTQVGGDVYKHITVYVPSSVVPSVTVAATDNKGYLSTYGAYVQGRSQVKVDVTASGSYGSSIASYRAVLGGNVYTDASFTTGTLSGSGAKTITTTVTDSRGRTTTKETNITVLEYAAPKISVLSVSRSNSSGVPSSSGAYLTVTFTAEIAPLNNKNGATYKVQYKKKTDANYSNPVTLTNYTGKYSVNGGTYTFAADTSASYDIILSATDNFETVERSIVGSSIKKLWSWLRNNKGLAFGKVAEKEETLECEFDAKFNNDVYGAVHGLGYGVPIPNGANIDTYTTVGVYAVIDNNIAASLSNMPVAKSGRLIVESGVGRSARVIHTDAWSYLNQIYRTHDGHIYIRAMYTYGTVDTWSATAWSELMPSSGGTFTGDVSFTSPTAGLTNRMYGVNKVLWSGAYFMHGSHTVTLSEAVSAQPHGIVLVWSWFVDSAAQNNNFVYTFIPKHHGTTLGGMGVNCTSLSTDGNLWKYVYINNTTITGYAQNQNNPSCGGVATANKNFVLRYVLGV